MDFMTFLALALSGSIPAEILEEMKARPLDADFKAINNFDEGYIFIAARMTYSTEMWRARDWFLHDMQRIPHAKAKSK